MTHFLYARVSTADQTINHQRTQAERELGITFDQENVISDDGVSGVKTKLADRDGGKLLLRLLRPGDVLVVRWLDRLGRDYNDVADTMRELLRKGVMVQTIINRMTFDGTEKDPMRKAIRDALIGFMAALGEAQAAATKEAQAAGIAHRRANPTTGTAYLGRKPSYDVTKINEVLSLHTGGANVTTISKLTGLSRQVIYRITDDPAQAQAIADKWAA